VEAKLTFCCHWFYHEIDRYVYMLIKCKLNYNKNPLKGEGTLTPAKKLRTDHAIARGRNHLAAATLM